MVIGTKGLMCVGGSVRGESFICLARNHAKRTNTNGEREREKDC